MIVMTTIEITAMTMTLVTVMTRIEATVMTMTAVTALMMQPMIMANSNNKAKSATINL